MPLSRSRLVMLVLGVLPLVALAAWLPTRSAQWLLRAAWEEGKILRARRPIAEVVADSATPDSLRRQLRLVLDARDYAASLGLAAKNTYRQFTLLQRDTLLVNVTAAPRDRIAPYLWHYPLVGALPYKGFFDPAEARALGKEMEGKGFDVYLWRAAAFSTLGWFEDPLLSTALTQDPVELAALVFHEIAHNTLWVPDAATFNESFAQYVGYHAAAEFFRARGDSVRAARALDRWHDEQVFEEAFRRLLARLDTLYAARPDSAALVAGRAAAGRWWKATLEGEYRERFRIYRVDKVSDGPPNNARLIGVLTYRTDLPRFERWHARHTGVKPAVAELAALLEGKRGAVAVAAFREATGEAPR